MEAIVKEILDNFAKHGTSQKTGKDWSMSRVSLSTGESVFIFNPVKVGDSVVSAEKDGYINWSVKKPDPKHDELMKGLRELYKLVKHVEARLARLEGEPGENPAPPPKPPPAAPIEPTASAEPEAGKPWGKWKQDEVQPVNGDEEINLEGIPF